MVTRVVLAGLVLAGCARQPPVPLAEQGSGTPALSGEAAVSGPLASRLPAPDDADLVVLYGGEQGGDLGVCGCEARPMGSLARVEGYRRALARHDDAPAVLLNAGGWLDDAVAADGGSRADARVANRGMVEGLRRGGWAAWNVGWRDLPALAGLAVPVEAVSANVRGVEGLARWRPVEVGPHTLAVTGVTGPGRAPEGAVADPVASVREVLADLEGDLVVVLAYDTGRATKDLARLEGVDVLIEADGYRERYPPWTDGHGVWVRSDDQTQRLGELRLDLEGGRVAAARDRLIDLDARIPSARRLRRLHRRTQAAVAARQQALFGAP